MRLDVWTLALQAVNALVLVWLLTRFLYRPVAAIIAQRRAEAAKLLADAAETRAQAQREAEALAAARAGLAAEGEHIRADAHTRADAERTALLDEARTDAAQLRHEAEAAIVRERSAAQAELQSAAADLALFIARRLLARLPPAVAAEAFRAALAADLAALPELARRQFLDPRETVTVASAVPLEAPVQQACRAMLAGAGDVAFATDPTLIAGIELRAPHATLRANWQAELQHIAAALGGSK
jgi:F-type H+-transporting ATPase subunit b